MTAAGAAALALLGLSAAGEARCVGDCDGDGAVQVAELLRGVNVALGLQPAAVCPGLADAGGAVGIGRLVLAVGAALDGCPPAPATATPTASATASATTAPPPASATASPTATSMPSATPTRTFGPNEPPHLPAPALYRAVAGQPIAWPLAAIDPEGGTVTCAAPALAGGMLLGADHVLRWTPEETQLGPWQVPVTCTDDGHPPAATAATLYLHVADDRCVSANCAAASGCTTTLPPAAISCCAGGARARVAPSDAPCPLGAWVEVGRNFSGFGPLQTCDRLRIRTFQQAGAETAVHVRARCLRPDEPVLVTVQLQAHPRGLAVNGTTTFIATAGADGVIERRNLRFAVRGGGPFFDLGEREANLTVTMRDADGLTASTAVRVRLTFDQLADLPG